MFQLNRHESEFLVKLAKKAVAEYLESGRVVNIPKDTPSTLLRKSGVFVTLYKQQRGKVKLRGCIGYPTPSTQLTQAVIECAISSATQDFRFSPLTLQELESTLFEVSVLTPPALINVPNAKRIPLEIKVGKDGLIVEGGMHKGLLLPQVPVKYNWDEEEFLCQCCLKAGLSPDAWLIEGTRVYKFSCIVIKEDEPNGSVTINDMRESATHEP